MPSKDEINSQIEGLLQSAGIRPVSNEEVQSEGYQLWLKASRILSSDAADSRAQEALHMLESALERISSENERLRAQCLQAAATATSYIGDADKTVKYAQEALDILDRTGPPIFAAMTRDQLARVLKDAGREREAKALWKKANENMDSAFASLRSFDIGKRKNKWWQFWK